jgi:uncharacterized membrane protein
MGADQLTEPIQLKALRDHILAVLQPGFHMGLDMVLALIPFLLSVAIFRCWKNPSIPWWVALLIFILVLPNAAYISTDVLHFMAALRNPIIRPQDVILLLVPEYVLYIYFGMQCHTLSLMNAGSFLNGIKLNRWILPAELGVNLLCAIGIYLGRFQRANSWFVITQPRALAIDLQSDITHGSAILLVAAIFLVITLLYYLLKLQDVAVMRLIRRKPKPAPGLVNH